MVLELYGTDLKNSSFSAVLDSLVSVVTGVPWGGRAELTIL